MLACTDRSTVGLAVIIFLVIGIQMGVVFMSTRRK